MNSQPEKPNSATGISWNLGDLYGGLDDPRLLDDLAQARRRAQAFETNCRGRIAKLNPGQVSWLVESLRELESLSEQMDKPLVYAMLVHSAKTDEPRHGALLAKTREERTAINKHLIFFDLEWIHLADETAQALMADDKLAHYRHYLEQKRAWKPHYLSEAEEKILDDKANTGKVAFGRLFEESCATIQFPFANQGETTQLSLQAILAKLHDPDRSIRRAAAEGISRGLADHSRLLTFIFNTIVVDHQSDCGLRHFDTPMASRNLANEIDARVVDALMKAVAKNYQVVQRYYRLKAKLLGIDQLVDYDRYAPLAGDMPACDWPTARRMVQESYEAFSPEVGKIIREFFDRQWIDAELRPGKRGGAFSSSGVPSVHPYILLNYTEKLRDVMTLAHELGHGVHQYLSRKQGYFQCDTPLTTAEMASVFGEMLAFQRLKLAHADPRQRLALLCGKIEDSFATAFRQIVLTQFELNLHQARRDQGELSPDAINQLWMAANKDMFGDSLKLTQGYASWWSYIGHFIRSPFYCYAYAFGELLVLALYQKYQREGADFVPKYLELLSSGGSEAPHVLLAKLGVDVNDPGFWELGLQLLDDMVAEAEGLAKQLP